MQLSRLNNLIFYHHHAKAVNAVVMCPSVCPPVNVGIVPKRLNVRSCIANNAVRCVRVTIKEQRKTKKRLDGEEAWTMRALQKRD